MGLEKERLRPYCWNVERAGTTIEQRWRISVEKAGGSREQRGRSSSKGTVVRLSSRRRTSIIAVDKSLSKKREGKNTRGETEEASAGVNRGGAIPFIRRRTVRGESDTKRDTFRQPLEKSKKNHYGVKEKRKGPNPIFGGLGICCKERPMPLSFIVGGTSKARNSLLISLQDKL